MSGFNLAEYDFDTQDHPNGEWHDAAVHVAGPATDDIEAAVAVTVNDTPQRSISSRRVDGAR
jgi:hypothetical protein